MATKLWLDDERPAPPDWVHCHTPTSAIALLQRGDVDEISLDHDLQLPEPENGYKVAAFIEEAAYNGDIPPLKWRIHSGNTVGRQKMTQALQNADRFWARFLYVCLR